MQAVVSEINQQYILPIIACREEEEDISTKNYKDNNNHVKKMIGNVLYSQKTVGAEISNEWFME